MFGQEIKDILALLVKGVNALERLAEAQEQANRIAERQEKA